MPSEHLEPQPYRVQQGRLLDTNHTRCFSDKQRAEYGYEERCRMFRDFAELDKGRSRTYIAAFNSPQECADFVMMHNRLIDKIDLLEYELKEALDELKMHGV